MDDDGADGGAADDGGGAAVGSPADGEGGGASAGGVAPEASVGGAVSGATESSATSAGAAWTELPMDDTSPQLTRTLTRARLLKPCFSHMFEREVRPTAKMIASPRA